MKFRIFGTILVLVVLVIVALLTGHNSDAHNRPVRHNSSDNSEQFKL